MHLQTQKIFRGGGVGCWVGAMNNCIFTGVGDGLDALFDEFSKFDFSRESGPHPI